MIDDNQIDYRLEARIRESDSEYYQLQRNYWTMSEAQYAKAEQETLNKLVEFRIVKRMIVTKEEVVG